MSNKKHHPPSLYPKYLGYAHAVETASGSRMLFISGLNGYESDGKTMPESFEAQSELIWSHLRAILASAGMSVPNLIVLRTYLADPADRVADAKMRKKQLGDHEVALTVIGATLLHPAWKIEIEAIASA